MFFKIGILKIFRNVNRKTPVLESLINKVQAVKSLALLIRDTNTGVFLYYCEIFKNSFFYKIPPVAASGFTNGKLIFYRTG